MKKGIINSINLKGGYSMKKCTKKFICFVLVVAFVLTSFLSYDFLAGTNAVYAKEQATKVVKTTKYFDGSYSQDTFTGKSKSGKTVWTYKCPKAILAQYDSSKHIVKGNKVYIWSEKTLIVLKKSTGKVLLKKKTKYYGNGDIKIDSKGNIYSVCADGCLPVKLNKNGKILWTGKVKGGGGGSYKLVVNEKKKTVTVYCEFSDYQYYVFDIKTGKYKKHGPKNEF